MVFVAALAVRVGIVLRSQGGYRGMFDYDSGVYYNAADALIHGRMPYSDFVLLHPPALMLTLTPFAWLGAHTSDDSGATIGNVAFEVLGAVIAALLVLLARRAGLGARASVCAGLVYALWPGSADTEISMRLEPLGNFFTVLGLLLLFGACRGRTPKNAGARHTATLVAAGALFGAAAVTKIWWAATLLIVVAWQLGDGRAGRRRAAALAAGAVSAMVVIAGPFFVHAPASMWRMVVLDQLTRSAAGMPLSQRLLTATFVGPVVPPSRSGLADAVLTVVLIVLVVSGIRSWVRHPALRLIVVLGAAEFAILLLAPICFSSYADFAGPSIALVVAGGVARPTARLNKAPLRPTSLRTTSLRPTSLRRRRSIALPATLAVLSGAALTAGLIGEYTFRAPGVVAAFPGRALSQVVAANHLRCVQSDSPSALIDMNVLSSDLANGCADLVDVSGSTYDLDKPRGGYVPRIENRLWQRAIYRYLTSGDAEIVVRHATGLSPATFARLRKFPVLDVQGRYRLRDTR